MKEDTGLTRSQNVQMNKQYEAIIKKNVEGLGLHRTLRYEIELDLKYRSKDRKEC